MSHLHRMTDRIQQRFRRARPGSVLILVVALLVLMALLGTAFISTARTDRYGAAMHAANTEIDLLVEGMVNQAVAAITQDLYAAPAGAAAPIYRPGHPTLQTSSAQPNGYEHFDSISHDLWLADRLPVLPDPEAASAPGPTGNAARFHGITFPFAFNDAAGTGYQFDSPDGRAPVALPVYAPPATAPRSGYEFIPGSATFLGQTPFPFLRVVRPGLGNVDMPAADTDGDGIADAGLVKIPVGTIDGITYYAAFRIIDHNSAINVNTAMLRNADFPGGGGPAQPNVGLFTSGAGLAELFKTYVTGNATFAGQSSEFDAVNRYRFHSITGATFIEPAGVDNGAGSPVADDNTARADFEFRTLGDALYHQLGRRILNPGRSTPSGAGAAADRFRGFGFADQAALSYRFCLVNLDSSPSPLEQLLIDATGGIGGTEDSLYKSAPNYVNAANRFRQYSANQVKDWFDAIADHRVETAAAAPSTYLNRRTILTTRNPVSNQKAAHYAGPTTAPTFDVPPAPGMTPYVRTPNTTYTEEPNPPAPPAVSINTAEFGELWRGFWNVMNGGGGTVPMHDDIDTKFLTPALKASGWTVDDPIGDPYHGQGFGTGTSAPPPYVNQALEQHPARQFRTPIRDTRAGTFLAPTVGARMSPQNVMLLRSALAAINAEDLRDSDYDVTSRQIVLEVKVDNIVRPCPVNIYGTERNVFITEVYVNTDTQTGGPTLSNPNGYIAVEISNPYPDPIELSPDPSLTLTGDQGWTVGLIDRRGIIPPPIPPPTTPRPQLTITPIDPLTTPGWRFPRGTIIPGAVGGVPGKLLLENYDPTGAHPEAARSRPAELALGVTPLPATDPAPRTDCIFVPGLHRVLARPLGRDPSTGGELVLLRPRAADAVCLPPAAPGDVDETSSLTLHDLVPVDQFDFTGATRTEVTPPFLWMHYVRENGPGFAWRFVYPGRYDANQTLPPAAPGILSPPGMFYEDSRHQGVQIYTFTPPAQLPAPPAAQVQKPVGLLQPDVTAIATAYVNPFTIQLSNVDFAGPNKIGAITPNQYPFGTFARNGDVLQVPFIGAYTIEYAGVGALPGGILEMNSVVMDSVFAEDTDVRDNPVVPPSGTPDDGTQDREQIGRFYPVAHNLPRGAAGSQQVDDFYERGEYYNDPTTVDDPSSPTTHWAQWRYRWGADIFEYFTVQAPNDDFFPNVAPPVYTAAGGTPEPTPVANTGGTASDSTQVTDTAANTLDDHVEDSRGVDGLININTAGWRVLSMLPMAVDPVSGAVDAAANNDLAKAIVYWRDVDGDGVQGAPLVPHGPFKSLHELNQVIDIRSTTPQPAPPLRAPGFRDGYGKLVFTAATDPGDEAGDISPAGTDVDGVRHDYEERTLTLARISNLVTTRSDMFTCYLLVQGWRDAGTANASLVVQRRVAFIVDRSETTPTANPQAKVTYVPNN